MTSNRDRECLELWGCRGGDCCFCAHHYDKSKVDEEKRHNRNGSRAEYFRRYNKEHRESRTESQRRWREKHKDE